MSAMHGELDAGRRHIDRALAAAEQLGDAGDLAFDIGLRGWLAFLRGDWRAARRDLETAAAESGNLGRSWYAPYPLIWLAELNLAEGRERAAAEKGEVAIALAEQNGDLQALHWASCVSARREMAEGQADAAAARLATLLEGAEAETLDVTMLLPWLAQARLEEGDVNRAAEIAAEGRARAEGERSRLALLDALRIQALIARQREQSEAAEQILEEALVVARSMPNPFKEACILADLGSLVGRDGNRARARERAEKALAIFRRLGAWREIERVEQMLSTLRSF
jgi:tetratricopeptide (TPR) repeat protein